LLPPPGLLPPPDLTVDPELDLPRVLLGALVLDLPFLLPELVLGDTLGCLVRLRVFTEGELPDLL
jgi:hypothetical protein